MISNVKSASHVDIHALSYRVQTALKTIRCFPPKSKSENS